MKVASYFLVFVATFRCLPINASGFVTNVDALCYKNFDMAACREYLGKIDISSLENNEDLFRFARANEKAFADNGTPNIVFNIVRDLARIDPENTEYYPYLVFLHKNKSDTIGDTDWWIALSYALQIVREQPDNQFGYYWTSVLLEELHNKDILIDSLLIFSVKNFEAAAHSDDALVNKLFTASSIRDRFVRNNRSTEAESFGSNALRQLDIESWAMERFQEVLASESAEDIASFITRLCNGSLVALDHGHWCLEATNKARDLTEGQSFDSPVIVTAVNSALLNAKRYAPENIELGAALSILSTQLVVNSHPD